MPSNLPQFTVRVEPDLLKKFRYIAEYNARSANREAEVLIKRHIKDFEQKHGPITFDEHLNTHQSLAKDTH